MAVSESTVAQLVRSLARMHKLIFNFGILRTCCMLGLACGRLNQNCNMVGTPPYYQVSLKSEIDRNLEILSDIALT